jgi:hypothetical protein
MHDASKSREEKAEPEVLRASISKAYGEVFM